MREKLLYEEYLKLGVFDKIYWVTYGIEDKQYAKELKQKRILHKHIFILSPPALLATSSLGKFIYSFIGPFLFASHIKNCAYFKTNQMDGAWMAFVAKILFKGKFYLRTGYTLSKTLHHEKTSFFKILIYRFIERLLYHFCDLSTVTSHGGQKYLYNELGIRHKVDILGNFIDTQSFSPPSALKKTDRAIFVGRLNREKNIFNMLMAIKENSFHIDLYGDGNLKEEIAHFIKENNISASLKGRVPNNQLPYILGQYPFYLLTSYYEGMPKTLLEAMACGCFCIGTNVDGINEVIIDGVNGILSSSTSKNDISVAIKRAKDSNFHNVSFQGRQTILKEFSLKSLIKKEIKLLEL